MLDQLGAVRKTDPFAQLGKVFVARRVAPLAPDKAKDLPHAVDVRLGRDGEQQRLGRIERMGRRHLERNAKLIRAKQRVTVHEHALGGHAVRGALAPMLIQIAQYNRRDAERKARPFVMLLEQQVRERRDEVVKPQRLRGVDAIGHKCLPDCSDLDGAVADAGLLRVGQARLSHASAKPSSLS